MDIKAKLIATAQTKHRATYGTAWEESGIDVVAALARWDNWNVCVARKDIKNKWKDILVLKGESVLYDPQSFVRHPQHHRPKFRTKIFVTVYCERGLTDAGCATSLDMGDFEFGTEFTGRITDLDQWGNPIK